MCSPTQKKLCGLQECVTCFKRSFASSPRAVFWHKEKNSVSPLCVRKHSNKKYWFTCGECGHTFDKALNSVHYSWCRFCAGALCGEKSCSKCFERSFAIHPRSQSIVSDTPVNLLKVALRSGKKLSFLCDKCGHTFSAMVNNVTSKESWCPYCCKGGGTLKLCNKNKCTFCYEKSLASHWIAKSWHSKNKETPRNVAKGTDKKYWFACRECNNTYKTKVSSITVPSNHMKSNRCPFCKNKTERKVFSFLNDKRWSIEPQATFKWCRTTKTLPYDFCLPQQRLMICVDGRQHFEQVMNWKAPEDQIHYDLMKTLLALQHGYSVIRLFQEDIANERIAWRQLISCEAKREGHARLLLVSSGTHYDKWTNHFNGEVILQGSALLPRN